MWTLSEAPYLALLLLGGIGLVILFTLTKKIFKIVIIVVFGLVVISHLSVDPTEIMNFVTKLFDPESYGSWTVIIDNEPIIVSQAWAVIAILLFLGWLFLKFFKK